MHEVFVNAYDVIVTCVERGNATAVEISFAPSNASGWDSVQSEFSNPDLRRSALKRLDLHVKQSPGPHPLQGSVG